MQGVLFVASKSKYSIQCMNHLRGKRLPFNLIPVRLDSKEIRSKVEKSSPYVSIKMVPTLLIEYDDGNTQLFIGIEKILRFISSVSSKQYEPQQDAPYRKINTPPTSHEMGHRRGPPPSHFQKGGSPRGAREPFSVARSPVENRSEEIIIDDDPLYEEDPGLEGAIDDVNILENSGDIEEIEVEYLDNDVSDTPFGGLPPEVGNDPRKKATQALQGFLINSNVKTGGKDMSSIKSAAERLRNERDNTLGYEPDN